MASLDDRITKKIEELEQLKQQKKDQQAREDKRQHELNNRRKFIAGEIFLKHFPDVLSFTTRQTADEKTSQIIVLENFVAALAANQDLIQKLKKEAT